MRSAMLALLSLAVLGVTAACESSDADSASCVGVEPPSVNLQTAAGEQVGVHGSYCAAQAGTGCHACVDRATIARQFTFVRPGDEATFSMPDGTLIPDDTCQPACQPMLRIVRYACDNKGGEFHRPVIEDQPWTVDLSPGAYTVSVDSHFEGTDNGWSGGISVGFGLVVDASHEPAVVDAASLPLDCEEADSGAPDSGSEDR